MMWCRSLNGYSAANGSSNIPHVDKMMFNKMRQRRLGAVDARSVRYVITSSVMLCYSSIIDCLSLTFIRRSSPLIVLLRIIG